MWLPLHSCHGHRVVMNSQRMLWQTCFPSWFKDRIISLFPECPGLLVWNHSHSPLEELTPPSPLPHAWIPQLCWIMWAMGNRMCALSPPPLRQKEKPLAVGGRYEGRALQERRALPSTASSANKGEGRVFMATEEGQFLSLEPALDHCSLSTSEKHHCSSPPGSSCCWIPASC